jgi:DNA-binding HxlR family transcriptional regulator
LCDYSQDLRYPLDQSFLLLGKKYATPILLQLLSGKQNFNALLEAIPSINSKTLSARLTDFRHAGLIKKDAGGVGSRQVRYELTSKGEDFRAVARELVGWSMKWHQSIEV